jgi:chromate reductase, NAD(P)H dehydrogenase (quinone)
MVDGYLIISGTNRRDSNTRKIAHQYQDNLSIKNIESQILTLEDVDLSGHNAAFDMMEKRTLQPAKKFIFIAPEYNGSIPGVLKTMLDLSDYKKTWQWKKALLVGISTGRSGNVRGLEHLTSILNYMKVVVHPNKMPISSVHKLLNGKKAIDDSETVHLIKSQIDEFIKF